MTSTLRTILTRPASEAAQMPLALIAGALLAPGAALWKWQWLGASPEMQVFGEVLAWISLGLGFIHGGKTAVESLREMRPDIDVLMVVGAAMAALLYHPEEGALLLFLFNLAGSLERRAMARARQAVSRLHKLMPEDALRRVDDEWRPVAAESLVPDDLVLVRPGETIPADGVVLVGDSSINQGTLTGESLPRPVSKGDDVFAGTLNEEGALEITVRRPVAESSIQKILALVLEAQERRQPIQRVIDKFSTPYTIVVFIVAFATLIGFWFIPEGATFVDAARRAITLLVVASPCALVLSTPTATLCGLSRAARAGVLVKGGDALERLARVRAVALDKTGTLTMGQIEVVRIEPVGETDVDHLLSIAMAAEERSTHPIAAAIVRSGEERGLQPAGMTSLTNVPGRGVMGVHDERPMRIGQFEFCREILTESLHAAAGELIDRVRSEGRIGVVIAVDGAALVLALADTPRPGAAQIAQRFAEAGVERVAMLTGDQQIVADNMGRELGITDIRAQLLPEEKVAEIERMQAELDGGGLAVIGDGVNDAPALAVADVGLAMGHIGADAALETADVVLLHDDLNRAPWSMVLARRASRIMTANLLFAIGVIAFLATFTLFGDLQLSLGVLGHEGSTLLVVANSLRLLAHRDPV